MPDKQPDDLLEPGAVEVARPVLRGEWPSDGLLLPDYAKLPTPMDGAPRIVSARQGIFTGSMPDLPCFYSHSCQIDAIVQQSSARRCAPPPCANRSISTLSGREG